MAVEGGYRSSSARFFWVVRKVIDEYSVLLLACEYRVYIADPTPENRLIYSNFVALITIPSLGLSTNRHIF